MNAIDLVHGDKKHRARKSGVKAKKKDVKDKKKRGLSTDRHNPRAFSVSNIGRTKKNQQRNLDRAQKKEVVPLINRTEELPPPFVVVVVGPRGVGKSTLIRSLVKLYTGQNMTDIKGPITVVAGKKQRLTFFECPIDIYSMTDLAKVADLVLIMIDSSYGFEMETFEFLNLLQLHGFPKVVGILTHMDKFKMNKTLQKTKKRLKNRFWTEIYKGAKLFDFTGVVNGKYLKHEVKRLSMYISRLKFRPLVWRNTHPYVLVDRVEDITSAAAIQENPVCDREISLFGYLRGTHLKPSMRVHMIGAGDYDVVAVSALEDPCPMPCQNDRTSLKNSKDNFLYAPFSNVGRVKIDKDGMYIEIKDVHYTKSDMIDIADRGKVGSAMGGGDLGSTPAGLLRSMQDVAMGVDERMHGAELSLFRGDRAVTSDEARRGDTESEGSGDEDSDDEQEEDNEEGEGYGHAGMGSDDDEEEEEDDDDEEEDDDDEEEDDDEDEDEDLEEAHDDFEFEENYSDSESEAEEDDEDEDDGDHVSDNGSLDEDNVEESGNSEVQWKRNMASKAEKSFEHRVKSAAASMSVMERVYGKGWAYGGTTDEFNDGEGNNDSSGSGGDSDSDDDLFRLKTASQEKEYEAINCSDSSRPLYSRWAPIDSQHRGLASAVSGKSTGGVSMRGDRSSLWKAFASKGGEKHMTEEEEATFTARDITTLQNTYTLLRNRFVTGDWSKANKKSIGSSGIGPDGGLDYMDDDDDEVFGDFEDLQTGEKFGSRLSADSDDDDVDGSGSDLSDNDDDHDDDDGDHEARNRDIDEQLRELNAIKKAESRARKEKGGEDGDEEMGKEALDGEEGDEAYAEKLRQGLRERIDRNRGEFGDEGEQARLQYEGARQGMYIRIVLRGVPVEFTKGFRPHLPLVLGGLLPHECTMGLVSARVKRHRWHKKLLKSNDVLTFSVGWRRYQSIPIFTMEEDEQARRRYLKYTPEHMHCTCTFYGPIVPTNTGILAYMKPSRNISSFRISLTGIAIEMQATSDIVKKLKLVGTPFKIHKNTAYLTGMFNSQLEVAKFEGAKIKTVSGIRGMIKKALGGNHAPGQFRATFEDQIRMSDIITCRLWMPVSVKEFYNPVLTLLEAIGDDPSAEPSFTGMRTVAEIRRDQSIAIPVNKDSLYKPITRVRREFSKILVPKRLQEALPFASKPKQQATKNKKSFAAKRAVVLEPEDRRKRAAVQMLETIRKDKVAKRVQSRKEKSATKSKEAAKVTEKFADVHKEEKRKRYREAGKEEVRREQKKSRTRH